MRAAPLSTLAIGTSAIVAGLTAMKLSVERTPEPKPGYGTPTAGRLDFLKTWSGETRLMELEADREDGAMGKTAGLPPAILIEQN